MSVNVKTSAVIKGKAMQAIQSMPAIMTIEQFNALNAFLDTVPTKESACLDIIRWAEMEPCADWQEVCKRFLDKYGDIDENAALFERTFRMKYARPFRYNGREK